MLIISLVFCFFFVTETMQAHVSKILLIINYLALGANSQMLPDLVVSLHYVILVEQVKLEKTHQFCLLTLPYIYMHTLFGLCVCVNICIGTYA